MNTIEEIEKLAVQCLDADYSKSQSVSEHNNAVDKTRELISNINNEEVIVQLLNNKNTSLWVAFQSLETPEKFSKQVIENAIRILKVISTKNCPESMAAEMRLKELNVKS